MALLTRKKVKYVSDAGALLEITWCILNGIVLPWRQSVSTAPKDVHQARNQEERSSLYKFSSHWKICWTLFKTIGHSLKSLGPSQKTLCPA